MGGTSELVALGALVGTCVGLSRLEVYLDNKYGVVDQFQERITVELAQEEMIKQIDGVIFNYTSQAADPNRMPEIPDFNPTEFEEKITSEGENLVKRYFKPDFVFMMSDEYKRLDQCIEQIRKENYPRLLRSEFGRRVCLYNA
jgi:hypothetical protein